VKTNSRRWWFAGAVILGTATLASAQTAAGSGDIEIVPIRGHMYLLVGAGANITLSAGPDGVFMVDAGVARMTDKVVAAVRQLTVDIEKDGRPLHSYAPPKPIRFLADTTISPDHTGGNEKIAEAGKTFTGGNVAADLNSGFTNDDAAILSTEKALLRLVEAKMPGNGQPTDTYAKDVMKLSHFFNGEGVELVHMPNATTDGDSVVWFRGSDLIATGDIFDMTSFPFIDMSKGGSIQGVLAALNRLDDMAEAEFRTEGGTLFVPGHGRIGDLADLAYYRDMVTIIRDRVQWMMKKDMSLAQIKAAKPTEDWNGRFGKNPNWTPDMFVEAIYSGLSGKNQAAGK
jgi:glyoxylase-like metal-dependent hydrolase (beta-lactamase superfamily II)